MSSGRRKNSDGHRALLGWTQKKQGSEVVVKIEQIGLEVCEIAADGSYVLVRVPVQVTGEPRGEATLRYTIGSFRSRETPWFLRPSHHSELCFRIPAERFRDRAPLRVEVVAPDQWGNLDRVWSKAYQARRRDERLFVEPLPE